MKEKTVIRNDVLARLREKTNREQVEETLWQAFYASPLFQAATCIAVTVSKHPELSTHRAIETMRGLGKQIVVPKTHVETRELSFHSIMAFSELTPGVMGILEPSEEAPLVPLHAIDTMIVPGVAFTKKGDRIGFGGGFYDRVLQTYEGATCALVFTEQLVESFPVESHDQRVQQLIIEENV